NAELKLQTESGDPIWVSWTLGSGYVSAFTSDVAGEWSASWFEDEAAAWQLKQILQAGVHLPDSQEEEPLTENAEEDPVRTLHLLIPLLLSAMFLFLLELICRKFRWKDVLAVLQREHVMH
ncbi:MAG: hypothetical protein IJ733_17725, partial [Lachnospiraceae bacterium]|nr:hypothetical protein [Lachnospiraceae bacterium]